MHGIFARLACPLLTTHPAPSHASRSRSSTCGRPPCSRPAQPSLRSSRWRAAPAAAAARTPQCRACAPQEVPAALWGGRGLGRRAVEGRGACAYALHCSRRAEMCGQAPGSCSRCPAAQALPGPPLSVLPAATDEVKATLAAGSCPLPLPLINRCEQAYRAASRQVTCRPDKGRPRHRRTPAAPAATSNTAKLYPLGLGSCAA